MFKKTFTKHRTTVAEKTKPTTAQVNTVRTPVSILETTDLYLADGITLDPDKALEALQTISDELTAAKYTGRSDHKVNGKAVYQTGLAGAINYATSLILPGLAKPASRSVSTQLEELLTAAMGLPDWTTRADVLAGIKQVMQAKMQPNVTPACAESLLKAMNAAGAPQPAIVDPATAGSGKWRSLTAAEAEALGLDAD